MLLQRVQKIGERLKNTIRKSYITGSEIVKKLHNKVTPNVVRGWQYLTDRFKDYGVKFSKNIKKTTGHLWDYLKNQIEYLDEPLSDRSKVYKVPHKLVRGLGLDPYEAYASIGLMDVYGPFIKNKVRKKRGRTELSDVILKSSYLSNENRIRHNTARENELELVAKEISDETPLRVIRAWIAMSEEMYKRGLLDNKWQRYKDKGGIWNYVKSTIISGKSKIVNPFKLYNLYNRINSLYRLSVSEAKALKVIIDVYGPYRSREFKTGLNLADIVKKSVKSRGI